MIKFWKKELSNISEKAEIGEDTIIHSGVHIHDEVKIGQRCQIQAQVFIPNGVIIEDDVFVGPQVCFTNDRKLVLREEFKSIPTLIKKGVKIGANSTIFCGITLGEDSIIGAGSVITKDVPANEMWFGNPARFIKKVKYDL